MVQSSMIDVVPGLYPNLSNEEYHASPGISKSGLDLIDNNPSMYRRRYIDHIDNEPTPAMILGSALHTFTLEPDLFDGEFVVAPKINKRTKAGKQEWQEFTDENKDKRVLSVEDMEKIKGMERAVRNHEKANKLLTGGIAESSIYYNEKFRTLIEGEVQEVEELVKVRPDYIKGRYVIDLKSTTDASYSPFQRSLYNYRYYVQAGMYTSVVVRCGEIDISNPSFLFICVEKTEPYNVAIYNADETILMRGVEEYIRCLKLYSEYKRSGYWPGYNNDEIVDISLPGYAINQLEQKQEGALYD